MKTNQSGRRSFLTKVALGGLATLSIPEIALSAIAEQKTKKIALKTNDVVLFQGDLSLMQDAYEPRQKRTHQKQWAADIPFLLQRNY